MAAQLTTLARRVINGFINRCPLIRLPVRCAQWNRRRFRWTWSFRIIKNNFKQLHGRINKKQKKIHEAVRILGLWFNGVFHPTFKWGWGYGLRRRHVGVGQLWFFDQLPYLLLYFDAVIAVISSVMHRKVLYK